MSKKPDIKIGQVYRDRLTGRIKFYHGPTVGQPIEFTVDGEEGKNRLVSGLCGDPEVEGFEIEWDAVVKDI